MVICEGCLKVVCAVVVVFYQIPRHGCCATKVGNCCSSTATWLPGDMYTLGCSSAALSWRAVHPRWSRLARDLINDLRVGPICASCALDVNAGN